MRNTRKSGQILRSKKRPRPTLRTGRGNRTNSNTSHQIPAPVIEADKVSTRRQRLPSTLTVTCLEFRIGYLGAQYAKIEFTRSICAPCFQYSLFDVNLNPKRARPPATMRAAQLTDFGTDQSPMITGQPAKIRTR